MTGKLTILQKVKKILFCTFVNSLLKKFPIIKTLIQTSTMIKLDFFILSV